MPTLTFREDSVLSKIRYLCRHRPHVEAGMVGSAGAVASLARKGYVRVELAEIGPQGGRYYRIVLR